MNNSQTPRLRMCVLKSIRFLTLVLALVGSLTAATINYTSTTAGYPNVLQPTLWSETLAFPKFNVPGATLTSIDFNLTALIGISATGTNASGTAGTYRYRSDGAVYTFPPELPPSGLSVYLPTAGSFSADPGPFSFIGTTQTGNKTFSLTGGSFSFARYTGSGIVGLNIFGDAFGPDGMARGPRLVDPAGNSIQGLTTNSAVTISISYNYTSAVPEPATAAMLTCGSMVLCCIGWSRRIRNPKSL